MQQEIGDFCFSNELSKIRKTMNFKQSGICNTIMLQPLCSFNEYTVRKSINPQLVFISDLIPDFVCVSSGFKYSKMTLR